MATRRFDDKGHVAGAMGIDMAKSNDFSRRGMDKEAIEAQFGRSALDPGARPSCGFRLPGLRRHEGFRIENLGKFEAGRDGL
jgi:hypothetical protein